MDAFQFPRDFGSKYPVVYATNVLFNIKQTKMALEDRSPDDHTSCVKCDILLCQEFGITSPHAELQKVNLEQREAVRRNLAFTSEHFREPGDPLSDCDSTKTSTLSGSLSPSDIPLPDSSFSSSENYHTADESTPPKKVDARKSGSPEVKVDLYCDEEMPASPPIASLKKRGRSNLSRVGVVFVNKKKRL